jgi:hypothetical protein
MKGAPTVSPLMPATIRSRGVYAPAAAHEGRAYGFTVDAGDDP